MAIGRIPKEEDGQHYSQSYTQPSDQMYSYSGGIRSAGYVGMASGGETAVGMPKPGREADVCEVHHVGGPTGSNTPKHGN